SDHPATSARSTRCLVASARARRHLERACAPPPRSARPGVRGHGTGIEGRDSMTADYIAFHASERPDAVALVDRGREITYARLSRDVAAFTRAAREFGLSPGNSAAVGWGDFYVHLLLLLALERLRVATASYIESEEPSRLARMLAGFDLALSGSRIQGGYARRHQAITGEWVQAALAAGDGAAAESLPKEPGDPLRILSTS